MQLVLNTPGSYLSRHEGLFQVKAGEKVVEVSPLKVQSILISTAAALSTDAIKLAIEHNIDILFVNSSGDPYARVWHTKPSSTTLIRRKQLEFEEKEEGLLLVLNWISEKIENQINLLLLLRDKRTRQSSEITETINKLREVVLSLKKSEGILNEKRLTIMGLEGTASRLYFQLLSQLMPENYKFKGRSRNPAEDEFNCLLNYAYGVLYGLVERAILLAGLDPYIGLLHTDNYAKKSLVFDLIERYRSWADEVVFFLFPSHKVTSDLFKRLENGFFLEKPGKAVLIEELNKFLDISLRYRNRNIKRRDIVQFDCHEIANYFIGKTKEE
jgi:CRISPR-associated protein Cas1